jgi:hypothetical protein
VPVVCFYEVDYGIMIFSYLKEMNRTICCRPEQTVTICERAKPIRRFHHDGVEFHVVVEGNCNLVVSKLASLVILQLYHHVIVISFIRLILYCVFVGLFNNV